MTKSSGSVSKFIRDPIHDIIKIDEPHILELLDNPVMQRLRYIRQLGFAWLVYPGAEHSRFTHSLGVYHLATLVAREFAIGGFDRDVVTTAALLHDIGHGPFSHEFEKFLKAVNYKHRTKHEKRSVQIVLEDDSVKSILDSVDSRLSASVADILDPDNHEHPLEVVVSSQLDVDRFDYMLRDSHMTGVQYGRFDLNWLLRTLSMEKYRISDPHDAERTRDLPVIAVNFRRGVSALEEYLLGLFYLYQHVYLHKAVLAANTMFISVLTRAVDLIRDGSKDVFPPVLHKIADDEELSMAEFALLNDFEIFSWMFGWAVESSDKILSELSSGLTKRELFKTCKIPSGRHGAVVQIREEICAVLAKNGLAKQYHMSIVEPERAAYSSYFTEGEVSEIYVIDDDGRVRILSEFASEKDLKISGNLARLKLDEHYLVVHPSIADDAKKIISAHIN